MSAYPFGGKLPASGIRACRRCGCTEHDACIDELTGAAVPLGRARPSARPATASMTTTRRPRRSSRGRRCSAARRGRWRWH